MKLLASNFQSAPNLHVSIDADRLKTAKIFESVGGAYDVEVAHKQGTAKLL